MCINLFLINWKWFPSSGFATATLVPTCCYFWILAALKMLLLIWQIDLLLQIAPWTLVPDWTVCHHFFRLLWLKDLSLATYPSFFVTRRWIWHMSLIHSSIDSPSTVANIDMQWCSPSIYIIYVINVFRQLLPSRFSYHVILVTFTPSPITWFGCSESGI